MGADWGGRDALTLARSQERLKQQEHTVATGIGSAFLAPCPHLNVAAMRGEPGQTDGLERTAWGREVEDEGMQ